MCLPASAILSVAVREQKQNPRLAVCTVGTTSAVFCCGKSSCSGTASKPVHKGTRQGAQLSAGQPSSAHGPERMVVCGYHQGVAGESITWQVGGETFPQLA